MDNIDPILTKFKEAFIEVAKNNSETIMSALNLTAHETVQFVKAILPCSSELERLKKLLNRIPITNQKEVLRKFYIRAQKIVELSINSVKCFNGKDYRCVGINYGTMLITCF